MQILMKRKGDLITTCLSSLVPYLYVAAAIGNYLKMGSQKLQVTSKKKLTKRKRTFTIYALNIAWGAA